MLTHPVLAFDIETIPDPEAGRRLYDLTGDDRNVVREMVRLRLEETDGRTEYPELPFHRIVAICGAWLDLPALLEQAAPASTTATTTASDPLFKLEILGGDALNERSHLESFLAKITSSPSPPRLISWNGNGFDLPVIRYRSMLHGIAAPELYRSEGEWKWNNYQGRYHDMHVDLMDVLSGYGASRWVGLGKMCDLLQIPSKSFLTKPIYEHILDGEQELVGEYCKLDCLDTLLVFLVWLVHAGQLEGAQLGEIVAVIREEVETEKYEGWAEIAEGLEGWPSWGKP